MKTPEEIMRRALSNANVSGDQAQVYIVANQMKALDAAGYAIVPKEPTSLMLAAGAARDTDDFSVGPVYRAMIAAAQKKEPAQDDRAGS